MENNNYNMSSPVLIPTDHISDLRGYSKPKIPSYPAPNIPNIQSVHETTRMNGPIPPPTPGPRPISNITDDAHSRFAGVFWIQKDDNKDLSDYFMGYEHYEPYSETKAYSKRIYQAAYSGLMADYVDYLFIIADQNQEQYFVVSKRLKSMYDELEKYCPCVSCTGSIFNPLKYLLCPICTKCIRAGPGFASSENIAEARYRQIRATEQTQHPNKQQFDVYSYLNWKSSVAIPIIASVLYLFI